MKKIGNIGENFVALWLKTQGYQLLAHNWHCRWGEIDLIAQEKNSLMIAFVEVKTRSPRNWDYDGILAINAQKQAKICQTAELFFSEYPHLADLPCRFDVALVLYRKNSQNILASIPASDLNLNVPIFYQNYQFTIKDYIQSAF